MSGVTLLSSRDGRYSLRHVQVSLGLSRAVIDGLVNAGFVAPDRGARNPARFSFQDLMLLRTAHELAQAKVAPRRIVEALTTPARRLPEGAALTGVRMSALGSSVIVRDDEGARDAGSGQFVMDFDALAPASDDNTPEATPHFVGAAQCHRASTVVAPTAHAHASRHAHRSHRLRRRESRIRTRRRFTRTERCTGRRSRVPPRHQTGPGHVAAAVNLSAMLNEQRRAADVDALCAAVLQSGVDHALLRFNHGLALEDLGRRRPHWLPTARPWNSTPTWPMPTTTQPACWSHARCARCAAALQRVSTAAAFERLRRTSASLLLR